MRVRIAGALAFVALIFVAARGEGVGVREIAPGVFFWQGDHVLRKPANCTWVVFKDYVLAIDANFPWGAREILPEIRRTTNKPIRFVFDTHYHSDHTFGNSVFADAGATVICSQVCAEELERKARSQWTNWRETGEHSLAGARFEPPTLTFTDRIVFDDGTQRVEITRVGPAHSKGDAVAWLPKQRILVTGDLLVNWNWGNNVSDRDADFDNWIRVLDDLAQWGVAAVVPGHGSLSDTGTLRAQRAYLSDMLGRVREGIKAGKSADVLAKEFDLSRHGSFGVNAEQNAGSIRGMYRKLAGSY
jgi:cyclase